MFSPIRYKTQSAFIPLRGDPVCPAVASSNFQTLMARIPSKINHRASCITSVHCTTPAPRATTATANVGTACENRTILRQPTMPSVKQAFDDSGRARPSVSVESSCRRAVPCRVVSCRVGVPCQRRSRAPVLPTNSIYRYYHAQLHVLTMY